MQVDPVPALLGTFAVAVVGALFAAGETAFTSLTHARLSALIDQSSGWQRAACERIRRDETEVRSRYLLGRLVCTAGTAGLLEQALAVLVPTYALSLALLGTVVLTGGLFEVSTTLARRHAERVVPTVARYLRPLELAMLPLAVPLGWLGSAISRNTSIDIDPRIAEVEVEMLVVEAQKSGHLPSEPAEIIRNVLEFNERTARDVMVPREKVEAIDVTMDIAEANLRVSEVGHSRYPVYEGDLDNVVGLLYAKDLFKYEGGGAKALRDLVRPTVNFVAGTQPLSSLLKEMRMRRQHLAVVVDELGAVAGIVTLEDILEVIVGDIHDEHDEVESESAPAPAPPPPSASAPLPTTR
ncbi:MAG TPA: hemolysin family protein [Byssovorax sp.]